MFATIFALAALVALVGVVIVRSASTLGGADRVNAVQQAACQSTGCAIPPEGEADYSPAPGLPRQWNGYRKPYTFDHMYRK
ncbi:MAG: hypothetical protein JRH19_07965 [Deltaproteobacteria bacterium]|nr:hypothetical protein [Deltaproteobacteria bacterium]